jgi:hypothetical protein
MFPGYSMQFTAYDQVIYIIKLQADNSELNTLQSQVHGFHSIWALYSGHLEITDSIWVSLIERVYYNWIFLASAFYLSSNQIALCTYLWSIMLCIDVLFFNGFKACK